MQIGEPNIFINKIPSFILRLIYIQLKIVERYTYDMMKSLWHDFSEKTS